MTTTLDLTELDQDVEGMVGTEQPAEDLQGENANGNSSPAGEADPDAGSLDLADDSAGQDAELRLTIPGLSTKLNILGVGRSPDEMAGWSDEQIREVTFWAEAMDRAIEADPEGEMPTMSEWMAVAPDLSQDAGSTAETAETTSEVPNASEAIPEASATAAAPSTALATAPTPISSTPAKPGQGASLAEVKASIQTQMVEKLRRLRAAELLYEEAKEEASERKKTIKAIQRRLNQLVQDLADCEAGTYQQLIPGATAADEPDPEPVDEFAAVAPGDDGDDDTDTVDEPAAVAGEGAGAATSEAATETHTEPSAPAEPAAEAAPQPEAATPEDDDYGGAKARAAKDPANHTSVREIGLTESQFEKLGAHEPPIDTVADLERAIRDGYLQKVKGVGPAAVDKITDKLMAWREENPVVQSA